MGDRALFHSYVRVSNLKFVARFFFLPEINCFCTSGHFQISIHGCIKRFFKCRDNICPFYLDVEKRFSEIVESLAMSVLNFFGEIIPILVITDGRHHLYRKKESALSSLQNKRHCHQIYHVGYTSSYSNTLVKQHWAWIILGWETPQGFSGSAAPPPSPADRAQSYRTVFVSIK